MDDETLTITHTGKIKGMLDMFTRNISLREKIEISDQLFEYIVTHRFISLLQRTRPKSKFHIELKRKLSELHGSQVYTRAEHYYRAIFNRELLVDMVPGK